MQRMTRYERISIIIAVVALVLAIASPIVSYFWFDPQMQAFRNRATLQVVGTPIDREKTAIQWFSAHSNSLMERDSNSKSELNIKRLDVQYEVAVTNLGRLPAKDIKILLQYELHPEVAPKSYFDPEVPYDIVSREKQQVITITRPLAPQEKTTLNFANVPWTISVSSEFGETTSLNAGIEVMFHSKEPVHAPNTANGR